MTFPIDPNKSARENLLALVNHANSSDLSFTDIDFKNIQGLDGKVEGERNTSILLDPKPEGRFSVAAGGVTVNYRRLSFAELILNPVEIKAGRTTTLTEIHQAICHAYGLIQDGVVTEGILPENGTILPGETFEVTISPSELGSVVYFPKPKTITITWDGVWLEALLTSADLPGYAGVNDVVSEVFRIVPNPVVGGSPIVTGEGITYTERGTFKHISAASSKMPGGVCITGGAGRDAGIRINGIGEDRLAMLRNEYWIECSVAISRMSNPQVVMSRSRPQLRLISATEAIYYLNHTNQGASTVGIGSLADFSGGRRVHLAFGMKDGCDYVFVNGAMVVKKTPSFAPNDCIFSGADTSSRIFTYGGYSVGDSLGIYGELGGCRVLTECKHTEPFQAPTGMFID